MLSGPGLRKSGQAGSADGRLCIANPCWSPAHVGPPPMRYRQYGVLDGALGPWSGEGGLGGRPAIGRSRDLDSSRLGFGPGDGWGHGMRMENPHRTGCMQRNTDQEPGSQLEPLETGGLGSRRGNALTNMPPPASMGTVGCKLAKPSVDGRAMGFPRCGCVVDGWAGKATLPRRNQVKVGPIVPSSLQWFCRWFCLAWGSRSGVSPPCWDEMLLTIFCIHCTAPHRTANTTFVCPGPLLQHLLPVGRRHREAPMDGEGFQVTLTIKSQLALDIFLI
ncbi:hypothetical protein EDB80DRAFT_94755 [Ilyonectria destructans]|nr:hypothetical protein EDB80DRAFT_94755 [Ilyonectria destructans]